MVVRFSLRYVDLLVRSTPVDSSRLLGSRQARPLKRSPQKKKTMVSMMNGLVLAMTSHRRILLPKTRRLKNRIKRQR